MYWTPPFSDLPSLSAVDDKEGQSTIKDWFFSTNNCYSVDSRIWPQITKRNNFEWMSHGTQRSVSSKFFKNKTAGMPIIMLANWILKSPAAVDDL